MLLLLSLVLATNAGTNAVAAKAVAEQQLFSKLTQHYKLVMTQAEAVQRDLATLPGVTASELCSQVDRLREQQKNLRLRARSLRQENAHHLTNIDLMLSYTLGSAEARLFPGIERKGNCPQCSKLVTNYDVDRVKDMEGQYWHKPCFDFLCSEAQDMVLNIPTGKGKATKAKRRRHNEKAAFKFLMGVGEVLTEFEEFGMGICDFD